MSEREVSQSELEAMIGGESAESGEVYRDLERRTEAVQTYLKTEAASMKDRQPRAYEFLQRFAEATLQRERGAALDTPPESVNDTRMAVTARQSEVDGLIRQFRELGPAYNDLLVQAESLREHLAASLDEISRVGSNTTKLNVLYREATTVMPLSIRDLSRDAYDRSLGPLASDEMFSHFPSEVTSLAQGEVMDDENDQAA